MLRFSRQLAFVTDIRPESCPLELRMAVRRLHRAWADAKVSDYPAGKQASAVIPILWRAQEQNGWVTEPMMRVVADMLGMAYIRVYEIATFYTMFQLAPIGRAAHVQVCGTTPCMLRGSGDLVAHCKSHIHAEAHHLSTDGLFSWEEVECLGSCANAPMVQIGSDTYEDLTPELLGAVLEGLGRGQPLAPGSQIGRRVSCPEGGSTTLSDSVLFDGSNIGAWKKRFPGEFAEETAPLALIASTVAVETIAQTVPPVADARMRAAVNVGASIAMANAGLVPELEARSVKPMSKAEIDSLRHTMTYVPHPMPGADRNRLTGEPNLLTAPRGGKGDDLALIRGVAEKLAAKMNDMGIWHFDQIAVWTPENIAWFEAQIPGFNGRIAHDQWREQCAKLASGWRPVNPAGEKPKG
jgi:NADH-quinone oxidoreductase subunit E